MGAGAFVIGLFDAVAAKRGYDEVDIATLTKVSANLSPEND